MSEATITERDEQNIIKGINNLLQQLNVDYQNTKEERKAIAAEFPANEQEFTVLEEIELLTVLIRGYGSQIQARGMIDLEQEAVERLAKMRVFELPTIALLYFDTTSKYPLMKAYLLRLDYLRLLILEYLQAL